MSATPARASRAATPRAPFHLADVRVTAPIQPRLEIGPVDDPFEREAEAIATQLLGADAAPPPSAGPEPAVGPTPVVGPEPEQQDEQPELDDRIDSLRSAGSGADGDGLPEERINLEVGGRPLDDGVRRTFEPLLRHDLSSVRVHTDAEAARLTAQFGAHAFTYGSHVWLGRGQRAEATFVMAHELVHVVQQSGAPVVDTRRAPRHVQRVPYWEPLNETGTSAHRRVIPSMARASNVFGEAPAPERGTGAGGLGTSGEVDFYDASGPGGQNTVGVAFNGSGDPRRLRAPHDMEAPSGYAHSTQAAPYGPANAGGTIERVDRGPSHIKLGELKPAYGADPEPQLATYEAAFQMAAGMTNDYARRDPASATWSPSVTRFGENDLTVPPEYVPGNTSQSSQSLVLKGFDVNTRRVTNYLTTLGQGIQGRMYVKFDGAPGAWVYAWVPDTLPNGVRLPREVSSLGADIVRFLRDPLFDFPVRRRGPSRSHRLLAGPISPEHRDTSPIVRRRCPPPQHATTRQQQDNFRAQYPQWQRDQRRLSEAWGDVPDRTRHDAEAAEDIAAAHHELFTDGWVRAPLTRDETDARQDLRQIRMWTGTSARMLGRFRYSFGAAFVKVANAIERLRDRFQVAMCDRRGRSSGDGITRAIVRTAFKVLKVAGQVLVSRTFDLLVDSLVDGVQAKMNEWVDIEDEAAFDALAARMEEIVQEIEAMAEQEVDELLGGGAVTEILATLEDLEGFQQMMGDISTLVNLVKWGLRIVECLSPPGWGCLWILAQAAGEELLAQVVSSCWFQKKVAPTIASLPWLTNLPATIASPIVREVNGATPGWLTPIMAEITAPGALTESDIPCEEPLGGSGGLADPAMADAMMALAEQIGEDRLRALAELSERMGVPAGQPMTADDLRRLGELVASSGLTAEQIRNLRPGDGEPEPLLDYIAQAAGRGGADATHQWRETRRERERRLAGESTPVTPRGVRLALTEHGRGLVDGMTSDERAVWQAMVRPATGGDGPTFTVADAEVEAFLEEMADLRPEEAAMLVDQLAHGRQAVDFYQALEAVHRMRTGEETPGEPEPSNEHPADAAPRQSARTADPTPGGSTSGGEVTEGQQERGVPVYQGQQLQGNASRGTPSDQPASYAIHTAPSHPTEDGQFFITTSLYYDGEAVAVVENVLVEFVRVETRPEGATGSAVQSEVWYYRLINGLRFPMPHETLFFAQGRVLSQRVAR